MNRLCLALMLFVSCSSSSGQQNKKEYPLFFSTDLQTIKTQVAEDKLAKALYQNILNNSVDFKPTQYAKERKGKLQEARKTSQQLLQHAFLYKITGKQKHLQTAVEYLEYACSFADWNPKHFLDVAEFTFGVSVATHWLKNNLTPKQQKMVRNALIKNAFSPYIKAISKPGGRFWTRGENNWTLVCNSALYVAAVLNPEINLSNEVKTASYANLKKGFDLYNPEGIWAEGPMYWSYATHFAVFAIEAEQWKTQNNSPLLNSAGFDKTLTTYFNLVGPSGLTFNYADTKGSGVGSTAAILKLASYYPQSGEKKRYLNILEKRLAATNNQLNHRFLLFNLLWLSDQEIESEASNTNKIKLINGDFDVVVVNTYMGSNQNLYLAMKGGNAAKSHQHRDAGTFVLDYGNTRFFSDLGKEEYGLKTKGGKKVNKRSVFRVSSKAHNVLRIGNEEQAEAQTSGARQIKKGKITTATLNLSPVYPQCKLVERSVSCSGASIVLEDYIVGAKDEVTWQALTKANVKMVKKGAVLTKGGKRLLVEIISPKNARFVSDKPEPLRSVEKRVVGFTRIQIRCPIKATRKVIVKFTPL